MENNIIGERIAGLLREQGKSQRKLAEQAGTTGASISRYIKGNRVPTGPVLANIAKALRTTTDYLLGNEQDSNDSDLEYNYIQRAIARNANRWSKKQKLDLVNALFENDGKCANVYDCADAIKALLSVDLDKVKQEFKQDVRAQMSSADLISRQAVIESIKRNTYRHTYLDQIIDIIKDFPSAQPEQQWIPCTERLPEKSGRYLVTRGSNVCGSLWNRVDILNYSDLMGLKKEKIWWSGNVGKSNFKKFNDVIAWVPLPESYKTITENEKVCNGCYYNDGEVHAECIVCDKQLISDTALEKMIATDYAHRLTMDKDRKGEKKMINFDEKAVEIVRDYIVNHLDKSDPMPDFQVFTVWKCKVLQNWKYLLSSTLFDGMYYELTYNGDKKEWYLDAYKKFQNVVVKEND